MQQQNVRRASTWSSSQHGPFLLQLVQQLSQQQDQPQQQQPGLAQSPEGGGAEASNSTFEGQDRQIPGPAEAAPGQQQDQDWQAWQQLLRRSSSSEAAKNTGQPSSTGRTSVQQRDSAAPSNAGDSRLQRFSMLLCAAQQIKQQEAAAARAARRAAAVRRTTTTQGLTAADIGAGGALPESMSWEAAAVPHPTTTTAAAAGAAGQAGPTLMAGHKQGTGFHRTLKLMAQLGVAALKQRSRQGSNPQLTSSAAATAADLRFGASQAADTHRQPDQQQSWTQLKRPAALLSSAADDSAGQQLRPAKTPRLSMIPSSGTHPQQQQQQMQVQQQVLEDSGLQMPSPAGATSPAAAATAATAAAAAAGAALSRRLSVGQGSVVATDLMPGWPEGAASLEEVVRRCSTGDMFAGLQGVPTKPSWMGSQLSLWGSGRDTEQLPDVPEGVTLDAATLLADTEADVSSPALPVGMEPGRGAADHANSSPAGQTAGDAAPDVVEEVAGLAAELKAQLVRGQVLQQQQQQQHTSPAMPAVNSIDLSTPFVHTQMPSRQVTPGVGTPQQQQQQQQEAVSPIDAAAAAPAATSSQPHPQTPQVSTPPTPVGDNAAAAAAAAVGYATPKVVRARGSVLSKDSFMDHPWLKALIEQQMPGSLPATTAGTSPAAAAAAASPPGGSHRRLLLRHKTPLTAAAGTGGAAAAAHWNEGLLGLDDLTAASPFVLQEDLQELQGQQQQQLARRSTGGAAGAAGSSLGALQRSSSLLPAFNSLLPLLANDKVRSTLSLLRSLKQLGSLPASLTPRPSAGQAAAAAAAEQAAAAAGVPAGTNAATAPASSTAPTGGLHPQLSDTELYGMHSALSSSAVNELLQIILSGNNDPLTAAASAGSTAVAAQHGSAAAAAPMAGMGSFRGRGLQHGRQLLEQQLQALNSGSMPPAAGQMLPPPAVALAGFGVAGPGAAGTSPTFGTGTGGNLGGTTRAQAAMHAGAGAAARGSRVSRATPLAAMGRQQAMQQKQQQQQLAVTASSSSDILQATMHSAVEAVVATWTFADAVQMQARNTLLLKMRRSSGNVAAALSPTPASVNAPALPAAAAAGMAAGGSGSFTLGGSAAAAAAGGFSGPLQQGLVASDSRDMQGFMLPRHQHTAGQAPGVAAVQHPFGLAKQQAPTYQPHLQQQVPSGLHSTHQQHQHQQHQQQHNTFEHVSAAAMTQPMAAATQTGVAGNHVASPAAAAVAAAEHGRPEAGQLQPAGAAQPAPVPAAGPEPVISFLDPAQNSSAQQATPMDFVPQGAATATTAHEPVQSSQAATAQQVTAPCPPHSAASPRLGPTGLPAAAAGHPESRAPTPATALSVSNTPPRDAGAALGHAMAGEVGVTNTPPPAPPAPAPAPAGTAAADSSGNSQAELPWPTGPNPEVFRAWSRSSSDQVGLNPRAASNGALLGSAPAGSVSGRGAGVRGSSPAIDISSSLGQNRLAIGSEGIRAGERYQGFDSADAGFSTSSETRSQAAGSAGDAMCATSQPQHFMQPGWQQQQQPQQALVPPQQQLQSQQQLQLSFVGRHAISDVGVTCRNVLIDLAVGFSLPPGPVMQQVMSQRHHHQQQQQQQQLLLQGQQQAYLQAPHMAMAHLGAGTVAQQPHPHAHPQQQQQLAAASMLAASSGSSAGAAAAAAAPAGYTGGLRAVSTGDHLGMIPTGPYGSSFHQQQQLGLRTASSLDRSVSTFSGGLTQTGRQGLTPPPAITMPPQHQQHRRVQQLPPQALTPPSQLLAPQQQEPPTRLHRRRQQQQQQQQPMLPFPTSPGLLSGSGGASPMLPPAADSAAGMLSTSGLSYPAEYTDPEGQMASLMGGPYSQAATPQTGLLPPSSYPQQLLQHQQQPGHPYNPLQQHQQQFPAAYPPQGLSTPQPPSPTLQPPQLQPLLQPPPLNTAAVAQPGLSHMLSPQAAAAVMLPGAHMAQLLPPRAPSQPPLQPPLPPVKARRPKGRPKGSVSKSKKTQQSTQLQPHQIPPGFEMFDAMQLQPCEGGVDPVLLQRQEQLRQMIEEHNRTVQQQLAQQQQQGQQGRGASPQL